MGMEGTITKEEGKEQKIHGESIQRSAEKTILIIESKGNHASI